MRRTSIWTGALILVGASCAETPPPPKHGKPRGKKLVNGENTRLRFQKSI